MSCAIGSGERFGRLTTVTDIGRAADGHRIWSCRCDCGTAVTRQTNQLRTNHNQNCGCLTRERATVHGQRGTRTYDSWRSAVERCHNETSKDWARYGAVGVAVCGRWRSDFRNFIADMGERPKGTTLDRWPNPAGNYEPGNCRWATPREQARNRRRAPITLAWRGEQRFLVDVAVELGITYGAAYQRLKRKGELS